jgi:hypothetical protein
MGMTFFKFIENSFETARFEQSKAEIQKRFSLWHDAECRALSKITHWQIKFFIFLHVPLAILRFFLVALHLRAKPVAMLSDQLERDKLQKAANERIAKEALELAGVKVKDDENNENSALDQ